MLVAFDTMMMVWGVQGVARDDQQHMISRAKRYIRHLEKNSTRILLPAPVVAEYLTVFDDVKRKEQLKVLQECFRIAPFDVHAAAIAAAIQNRRDFLKRVQQDYRKTRVAIKTDCQIVAIAQAKQVDVLVSHDPGLRKVAEGHVLAIDIPDPAEQREFGFPE